MIISWFGVSLHCRYARGTCGTLAALPFAYVIQITFGNIVLAAAGCALFAIGVIAAEKYVNSTGKQDPGEIVIDEAAAIFMLLSFMTANWQCYLAAFVVFRIFDVLKPWPVSLADRKIKGGLGVMVDDVLAALYPVALMLILNAISPETAKEIMSWLKLR